MHFMCLEFHCTDWHSIHKQIKPHRCLLIAVIETEVLASGDGRAVWVRVILWSGSMANMKHNIEDNSAKAPKVMQKWVHPGEERNHEAGGELECSPSMQVWCLGPLLLEPLQGTSEGRERKGFEGVDRTGLDTEGGNQKKEELKLSEIACFHYIYIFWEGLPFT